MSCLILNGEDVYYISFILGRVCFGAIVWREIENRSPIKIIPILRTLKSKVVPNQVKGTTFGLKVCKTIDIF